MLCHPELASLSCEECRRWMFNPEAKTWHLARGQRIPRPKNAAPPCWKCPKQGLELSAKNAKLIQAFFEHRRGDTLTRRLYGIIRLTLVMHRSQLSKLLVEVCAKTRL